MYLIRIEAITKYTLSGTPIIETIRIPEVETIATADGFLKLFLADGQVQYFSQHFVIRVWVIE